MSESKRCKVCGKPLSPSSGDIGDTCLKHAGKVRQYADQLESVPEGWIRMSKVCRFLEEQGFKTSTIVNAAGGDAAANKEPIHPLFKVVYVGRGKFMNPEIMVKGAEILRGHVQATEVKKEAKKANGVKSPTAEAILDKLQEVVK